MKAIETRYKGYRFRSRLEARWAVFFDTLGLKWEYEPEGYDLGFGVWYLPDFFVRGQDGFTAFVEVKPVDPSEEEIRKLRLLGEATDTYVCFLIGVPGDEAESDEDELWHVFSKRTGKDYFQRNTLGDSDLLYYGFGYQDRWGGEYHLLIEKAEAAARGARFQKGMT